MTKHLFHFSLIIAFSLSACNDQKAKEQSLYDQVMATHDEVMPEMGNLRSLSKKLTATLDSLKQDSVNVDSAEVAKINVLLSRLDSANASMMQWMHEFEPLEEGTPHGEVMQFLLEEKKKIDKVKKDMLEAKDSAEQYYLD